jgi:hypothetical protein
MSGVNGAALVIVFIALSGFGCKEKARHSEELRTANDALPVIQIDNKHFHQPADGSAPPNYEVAAAPGVLLDSTGYTFEPLPQLDITKPNVILVVDSTGMYTLDWAAGRDKYELSAKTLTPVKDAKPFTGFKAGEEVTVLVAYQEINDAQKKVDLFTLWQGNIAIQ